MKKIVFMLAILLIAAPAWATVYVTCSDSGGGVVTISYDATGESSLVRAFALDITANDANIVAVNDVNPKYWVYPGSIVIVGNEVNDVGSAVCDAAKYPETLPGPDSNGVTVEMGSLYVGGPNAPGPNGVLCTITVNANCHVDGTTNDIRGGVVLEDGTVATVDVTGCDVEVGGPCFPEAHPDYAEWLSVGSPDSWCYPRQCHGDSDGQQEQVGWFWYYVAFDDLNIFIDGWQNGNDTDPNVLAADCSHSKEQVGWFWYRVAFDDLDILIANWQTNPDPNCLDVP